MLTEKEKEMLNTPASNRDPALLGEFEIQDAIDLISLHGNNMTSTNEETVLISLNEIVNIIVDAYSLGYTRGGKR